MKREKLELLLKKGLKKKTKITLSLLVLFLINGNISYGEEVPDFMAEDLNDKQNMTLDISNITQTVYGATRGLYIGPHCKNIKVNINEINGTLEINDKSGVEPYSYTPGLYGISNIGENVTFSDGLKINLTSNNDYNKKDITLTGVFNYSNGTLILGKNTEINITSNSLIGNFSTEIEGLSIVTNKQASIIDTKTIVGQGSRINITSADTARIYGIELSSLVSGSNELILEDDIGIKIDMLDSKNSDSSNLILGITNSTEDCKIIAGNNLVVEAKASISTGAYTAIGGIYNAGTVLIGDGLKTTVDLNTNDNINESVVASINNVKGSLTIGNNAIIKTQGKGAYTTYGIKNVEGESSIGNNSEIIVAHDTNGYSSSYAYGVSNSKGSLNIGKNALISVTGKNKEQITGIFNNSTAVLEDGSTIEVIGKDNDNARLYALWNADGNMTIKGGTTISSNSCAIYNTQGNVLINDEGYTKKIKGYIYSKEDLAITDILLDTKDSYFEGNSFIKTGKFNLGLKNNAVWYNTGESQVSNFDMENGIVDMTQNHKGETIKGAQYIFIDNATGNGGTYILDISPEDKEQKGDKTDGIYITKAGAPQNNYIQVGKNSITDLVGHNFADKTNNSILIANTDKNVTFEGKEFSDISNVYDYKLMLEQNVKGETDSLDNWYVTGINKKEGEVVEKIEEDLTLNYMNAALSRLEVDTIHKRLGEIRDYTSENGVWARIVSGEMEHNKSSGKFKNDYNMLQVGYDKRKETEKGSVFAGFAVHKRDGKTDFRNGDGKNHNIGISIYKSFAYNDNSYTDIIFKYSHLDNDYKNYTENNQKLEADYNTWAGSLSLEHGKKYEKNAWYVTPHVQMNYTYVKGADYSMNSGVRVEQRDIKSLIGRAEIYAGHDFKKSSHFVKAGVLHEFAGEYGAKITGEDASLNKKYSGRDTWVEVGIGGQFKVGKTGTTHLYYDVEKTFGSDFETNWQASVGVRIEL